MPGHWPLRPPAEATPSPPPGGTRGAADRRRAGDGASVRPPGPGGQESPAFPRPAPAACARALSSPAAPTPGGEPHARRYRRSPAPSARSSHRRRPRYPLTVPAPTGHLFCCLPTPSSSPGAYNMPALPCRSTCPMPPKPRPQHPRANRATPAIPSLPRLHATCHRAPHLKAPPLSATPARSPSSKRPLPDASIDPHTLPSHPRTTGHFPSLVRHPARPAPQLQSPARRSGSSRCRR